MNPKYTTLGQMVPYIKKLLLLFTIISILFLFIGIFTSSKPIKRLSSSLLSHRISATDHTLLLQLFNLENNSFSLFNQIENQHPHITKTLLNRVISMSLSDMNTFIRIELPSYSVYEHNRKLTEHYLEQSADFVDESGPPLENVLEKRKAVDLADEDKTDKSKNEEKKSPMSTEGKEVVFLYSTHNRESFLPHLPDEKNANNAYHGEVNITKVSTRLANQLHHHGIGAKVDTTDVTNILHENGWSYGQSYKASRPIVEEAIANNNDIKYIFDIHRDSLSRNLTTKKINGEKYAKVLFVIGKENEAFEKNLSLAKKFHDLLNEALPNVSRGVITKEGPKVNGVYNQDLNENAILMEIGGHENTLEEMYRTVDVLAEVFSQLYWEAEEVSK